MNKHLLIIVSCFTLLFASCAQQSDITNLQGQIDELKSGRIASIESQISSITASISTLQEADREIKGYITALQNTASELQKSINTANGNVDDLQKSLALVNTAIETLQAKDIALEKRIDDLKEYVDTQLKNTRDWVSATFATLEQYNGIVSEIGGLRGSISSINSAMEQMESRLSGKIESTKAELESAYTKAIGTLETSLKNWVNDQLKGYWTIAETEAKLAALKGSLEREDESIREDIDKLSASLDSAKTELTEGYRAAIKKAIEDNNGVIDVKISSIIEEVNNSISSLEERVADLETRMLSVEKSIEQLFSKIQSINVVPNYNDGSVSIIDEETDIYFEVLPRSVSVELAKLGESVFSLDAVYTQTRSSAFINLPVLRVVDNGEFLVVTTKGKNLGSAFFDGSIGALARLKVYDGNNETASGFFSLYATPVVDLSVNGTANCYIVSKAGTYKFNACVKGNSTESVGTPISAEVLWESFGTNEVPEVGDIISKAVFSGGYIIITTPSILKDGNAVIAVKDGTGNILWSWHIWVCYGYDLDSTQQIYNNDAGIMMDRNLGATSAVPGDVKALGLLYQWGRKDPFLNGDSIVSTTAAKSTITWPSAVASDLYHGTIQFVVENPTTLVSLNWNNQDWWYTKDLSTDDTRWTSEKSIYDPCPKGWRVPDGGDEGIWAKAFGRTTSWITASNWDNINRGMDFGKTDITLGAGSIWYPSTGGRNQRYSLLSNVGITGDNWSCTPSGNKACALNYNNDNTTKIAPAASTLFRADGRSVRCCKEE